MTLDYSTKDFLVQGFTDADWTSCLDTRKSTGGYCFILSGAAITWQSNRQTIVAKSSTELEYMSLFTGASEALWIQRLLTKMGSSDLKTPLPITNTSQQIHHDIKPISMS